MKQTILLFLILHLARIRLIQADLTIESPPYNGTRYQTAQYYYKDENPESRFTSISGTLVAVSYPNITGKIVFLPQVSYTTWLDVVLTIQKEGAIAIIYGTPTVVAGQYGCAQTSAIPSGVVLIPVAEISQISFVATPVGKLLKIGTSFQATLTSEGNPWVSAIHSIPVIIIFWAFFSALSLGLIGWALYKLIMFIKFEGPKFDIPQVCLALDIIGNLLRFIYFAIDPFGCWGTYGAAFTLLTTISFPYTVATFVLLTFYWWEAVSNASIKIYPFLHRLKIPFFVITIAFIAALFILTMLSYFLVFSDILALIIIYSTCSGGFFIFFMITLKRINQKMKQLPENDARKKKIKKINTKVILTGVAEVLTIIPPLLLVSPVLYGSPVSNVVISAFLYIFFYFASWTRIYLFAVPKPKPTAQPVQSPEVVNDLSERRAVAA